VGRLNDPRFRHIAIVGYGLVGASIAKAATRRWPSTQITAIGAGEGLGKARGADLVVLAAPVLASIARLTELPEHLTPDTIVTDVCSTKRLIAAAAAALPMTFIGGHPMAGGARGGVANARADLFDGRPWILTPGNHHTAASARLEEFVAGLGGVPHVMTPELHDRFVGAVSHLPQLTASALMHLVGERAGIEGLSLAGRGLSDTTRLASSPVGIWRDIIATNQDNIAQAIDELVDILLRLKAGARDGTDPLGTTFDSAAHWKRVLEAGRETS